MLFANLDVKNQAEEWLAQYENQAVVPKPVSQRKGDAHIKNKLTRNFPSRAYKPAGMKIPWHPDAQCQ